ncbi:MAG TPA: rhodanese-like domain-containing protein [Stenotrophobium sp.]|nr:rhodanese-like domain-containing protein [Stenotrophobium sp.]
MAATHSPAFLALVDQARRRIRELSAAELPAALQRTPRAVLLDVREESEYTAGHVSGARWLGKGIIERDIEAQYPDRDTPLYLYCGGGYRSALATDNLQQMGYRQVWSVDGGWRELRHLLPVEPAT